MLNIGGLLRTTPVSRLQMSQLVGSISGYSDGIIPSAAFQLVSNAVQQSAVGDLIIARAFWKPESTIIAEILHLSLPGYPRR